MSDVHAQRRNLPLLATKEACAGRTYIVTGANTGLGFEAAKHLVALGSAKVILAVRNTKAGNEAKVKIESATGVTGVADVWLLDLADYDSVKAFASKAIAGLGRIDGLIENASVASVSTEPINGQNANISINVIGTFLLAALLLPKLKETAFQMSAVPHLVFVSSRSGFEIEQLWNEFKDDPFVKLRTEDAGIQAAKVHLYPLSKLIETFAARHLASLLPVADTKVVINTVCPGICVTDLDRSSPPEFRTQLTAIRERVGRTAEDGSRTLLHAVVAGEASHGLFLHSCEVGEADVPQWVTNDDGKQAQKHIWELVRSELERIDPDCVANIL